MPAGVAILCLHRGRFNAVEMGGTGMLPTAMLASPLLRSLVLPTSKGHASIISEVSRGHVPRRRKANRPMSHDTWIHKIARATVSRPLARTRVQPNHLTTLRLVGGIAAAACFAIGSSGWWGAGAAAFVVSMLLDRADGDLARLTGRTSPFGHRYDLISDAASNALAFAGIGIGLRESALLGGWAVPLGLLAGLAVATVLWAVMRLEEGQGARAGELRGVAGFDPDDAMLAVPAAVLLGWTEGLLIAAAIGAPAFALFFLWLFRRQLRAERAQQAADAREGPSAVSGP